MQTGNMVPVAFLFFLCECQALVGSIGHSPDQLLRLRGGSTSGSAAARLKEKSCYPLHGEGDTEGREVGSMEDPYSVAAVSAGPAKAVEEIERLYLETLREDPNDIVVRFRSL